MRRCAAAPRVAAPRVCRNSSSRGRARDGGGHDGSSSSSSGSAGSRLVALAPAFGVPAIILLYSYLSLRLDDAAGVAAVIAAGGDVAGGPGGGGGGGAAQAVAQLPREGVSARLRAALDARGRGRLVVLHGPAGCGKSTIAVAVGVAAAREGRPVLRVACQHRGGGREMHTSMSGGGGAAAAAAGASVDDELGAAIVGALRGSMWANHAVLSALLSYGGGRGDGALYRALTSIAGPCRAAVPCRARCKRVCVCVSVRVCLCVCVFVERGCLRRRHGRAESRHRRGRDRESGAGRYCRGARRCQRAAAPARRRHPGL